MPPARTLTAALGSRARLTSSWVWALVLAVVIVAGGGTAAALGGHLGTPLTITLIAFFALIFPYMAFLTTSFARDLGVWLRIGPAGLLQGCSAFLSVYLLYALGTQSFAWEAALRVALFVAVPTALVSLVKRRSDATWQDFAAIACIWLPFDAGWLKTIWTWPEGGGAYVMNTALAVNLAVMLFAGYRGFTGVVPRFRVTREDLRLAVLALLAFMTLALPAGFATGFVAWNPQITPVKLIGVPLGIFFFVAIPEELLFRGLVQNLLERRFGRPTLTLIITSVAFGATHLNNGPSPDWRYFVLATVAGGFYGFLYRKTRGLTVPALMHAGVDTLWLWFFHV